jgi:excisionase family DNA binding protein
VSGRQDGTIPIAEAAELLGLSQEAVRKRIQRGSLAGMKEGGHWFVLLDRQDVRTSGRQDDGRTQRQDASPIPAAYQVTPAEVEQAIERTGARYVADFAALYDRISAEVGRLYEGQLAAKDETLAAKDEAIDELRRRAELAEERASNERAERAALVAAKNQTIAELQHRADLAEQEAVALRERVLVPVVALGATLGAPSTPEASASPAPADGLRARLGRWWRGKG